MKRRDVLRWAGVLLAGGWGAGVGYPMELGAAPPAKALVLVYAAGQELGSGVRSATDKDDTSPLDRNLNAARAVRERLDDNDAVSGTLFNPDSPLFQRAAQEAGVKLNKPGELPVSDRVAIAKAAGAVYMVIVGVRSVSTETSTWEMMLQGVAVSTGKIYSDRVRYQGATPAAAPPAGADPNAVSVRPSTPLERDNTFMSAANTLVVRLLAGPLGEYGRSTPPPGTLPPPIKPTGAVPIISDEDYLTAALQQGKQSLGEGDSGAAIAILRKAVNRRPLDSRPRILLVRAYIAANRGNDAASEARRALLVAPPATPEGRAELSSLMAQALTLIGDVNAARSAYEGVIAEAPNAKESNWARLALAGMLLSHGDKDAAADQYRAALKADRNDKEAAVGLARLLSEKGDFVSALAEIAPESVDGTPASKAARYSAAVVLFEVAAPALADLLKANRAAWEAKTISREIFYKATKAQAGRAAALVIMLKSAPPDASANSPEAKLHARRVLAATLLAQSAASLQSFLESGDEDANSQSSLSLLEFAREFAAVKGNP